MPDKPQPSRSDVINNLQSLDEKISIIKRDMTSIKSDISIIKDYISINREKEKENEVSKGWFY
jgi:hypothetical protein